MRPWAIALVIFIGLCAGCSIPTDPPAPASATVAFSAADRQRIADFYAGYEYPPELADPATIAPDLKTRLEASGKLPPGIAAVPLPVDLEDRLSLLPPGYVRFRAGNAVILMDTRIWQVVDQVPVDFR